MAKVISFFKPQSSCKTNIDNLKEVLSTSSEEERASSNRIVSIMREWTSAVFNQINREHFSAGHTKVVFEYDDNTMAINTKQLNASKIQSTSLGVQQIQHNLNDPLPQHVTDQNKTFVPKSKIQSTSLGVQQIQHNLNDPLPQHVTDQNKTFVPKSKIQSTSLGVQQIQHNLNNPLRYVTDQNKVLAPNQITSTSPKKIVNAFLLDYKELIALPDAEFEDAMNRIYSRLCKITYLTPIKGNIFQLHSPTWGLYVGDSIANMYTNITTGTKYLCDNCISFWIDM